MHYNGFEELLLKFVFLLLVVILGLKKSWKSSGLRDVTGELWFEVLISSS